MKKGISLLSVIPIRIEPNEKCEMLTQILFGETFSIIDVSTEWIKIKTDFDNYEGWISQNMCYELKNPIDKSCNVYTKEEGQLSIFDTTQRISAGSELPNFDKQKKAFQIDGFNFKLKSGEIVDKLKIKKIDIPSTAYYFLNTPYLWGGRSIWGIDCSGLVQLAYKINNIKLPRDTSEQVNVGENISFINEAKGGDLAFFDNEDGEIIHVGICLSNSKIIHAHGKVKIDILDQTGIYDAGTKKYSHRLRIIKRVL